MAASQASAQGNLGYRRGAALTQMTSNMMTVHVYRQGCVRTWFMTLKLKQKDVGERRKKAGPCIADLRLPPYDNKAVKCPMLHPLSDYFLKLFLNMTFMPDSTAAAVHS